MCEVTYVVTGAAVLSQTAAPLRFQAGPKTTPDHASWTII